MGKTTEERLFQGWFQQLALRYVLISIATVVAFGTAAALLNPAVEIVNVRALFTTLATAEASVLAIVFSVTVVALQLVVTRYSARLTTTFVNDPLFRTTFSLFVIAIAFNLIVVYLLPPESNRLTNAAVGASLALASVSTIALYQFIQMMIERGSPDQVISVLVDRTLAPSEYLPETIEEFQQLDAHPVRKLYQTLAQTIKNGEYQAAEQGINGLHTVLSRTIEYLETEHGEEDPNEYVATVTAEPFEEYYPRIIEQAYSHEQYNLISETVEDIETLALDGLDRGFAEVTESAADGLGDAFNNAPSGWEGNRLRTPVAETLTEVVIESARRADYAVFSTVFFQLNHQMVVLLRRRSDIGVTERLVGNYYTRGVVSIFEALTDQYASELRNQDTDWISPTDGRQWTLSDDAKPIRHLWQRYTKFTQAVLRYRTDEGKYPFAEGSIDDGWKKITTHASESGLHGFATLCCITTIQLAYRVDQIGEGNPGTWVNNLGLIRLNQDPAVVDKAFTILKQGENPEGANINVHTPDMESNSEREGFFERFLHTEPEETSFEQWIVDFEKEVEDRTEYLRENA
jgi:hypothetical protein